MAHIGAMMRNRQRRQGISRAGADLAIACVARQKPAGLIIIVVKIAGDPAAVSRGAAAAFDR